MFDPESARPPGRSTVSRKEDHVGFIISLRSQTITMKFDIVLKQCSLNILMSIQSENVVILGSKS